jgi:glycine oxidase
VSRLAVTVVGGGILGLWQALVLAQRGNTVTLHEAAHEDGSGAASRLAGAMLAPHCESEIAEPIITQLGLRGLGLWRQVYSGCQARGSLVLAADRDRAELLRFARMTGGHRSVDEESIAALEPALSGRFHDGLFFQDEAHLAPRPAIEFLIGRLRELGVDTRFASPVAGPIWMAAAAGEVVIDCRGMSAGDDLAELRGVRGEMAVVHAPRVDLSRPIRLLHPRFPLYIVPWGNGTYMIGATSIECAGAGPVTVRSALDLFASACVIHPGFADAHLIELSTGIRPAFNNNVPRIIARGRRLIVNGAYRHGFLLAPALAEIVADHLESGAPIPAALNEPG